MKISTVRFAAVLFCLTTLAVAPATKLSGVPKVGNTAPEFSLQDLAGKTGTLSELTKSGPVVVVQLRGWVGYQCPFCTKQVADFMGKNAAIEKTKAHVVFVYPGNTDDLKTHADDFVSGKDLPANVSFVLDPGLKFVDSFGLRWSAPKETAYPATFVVDAGGIVRFAQVSHVHGNRVSVDTVLKVLDKLAA